MQSWLGPLVMIGGEEASPFSFLHGFNSPPYLASSGSPRLVLAERAPRRRASTIRARIARV
jgi:hypothetical protein